MIVFVHRSLQSCMSEAVDNSSYPDTEMITVNVFLSSTIKLSIVCSYIPPNVSLDAFSQNIIYFNKVCTNNDLILAIGDYNLPTIDWKANVPGNDAKSIEFFDCTLMHGLQQYITEPTRMENILDLLLCNDYSLISDVEVGVPFGQSDHNSITCSLIFVGDDRDASAPNQNIAQILKWDRTDWQNFSVYCQRTDWYDLISELSSPDTIWESFCTFVEEGIAKFVPKTMYRKNKTFKQNHKTKVMKKLHAKKRKLWLKIKNKSPTKNKKAKYKEAAKQYKLAAQAAQESSERKLIDSDNLGQFYKHVNKASVHKTSIGPLKAEDGKLVLDDLGKAELLNAYFIGVCTKDNGDLPPMQNIGAENKQVLRTISFRTEQIRQILKKLKNKLSSGPDGIPPIIFKNLANQLAYPLAVMFNIFMQSGSVPSIWKRAIVIPIYKKGSSSIPKNYRPISLTCVGSKIFETAIKSVLVPFLERKNLLSENQHGFRPRHSTCLNLLESLNDWTENLDLKANTYVAHVDFARAFDSVSLPKLMHKLNWAGVEGQIYLCLKSLLLGRSQSVKIGNHFSNYAAVSSGVPQGSVLGPILFIFYIDDISEGMHRNSVPKLYADDLKAYISSNDDKDCKFFKETLLKISNWSDKWQLHISCEKSKWLSISNKNGPHGNHLSDNVFELAGVNLPQTNEVLDLGVIFNSRLNFSDHISSIVTKAKQRLFLLNKIFISKNPHIMILAFKTYVIPLLEYCSQVWNPQNLDDVRRLESVQRKFTKRLSGYQGLNYAARLDKASLPTLELRRLRADLHLCYKILHRLVDTNISKFFNLIPLGDTKTRGHSWKLKSITPRLNTRLNFFSFRVTNAWNSLSPATVDAKSFTTFKNLLRSECLDSFLIMS